MSPAPLPSPSRLTLLLLLTLASLPTAAQHPTPVNPPAIPAAALTASIPTSRLIPTQPPLIVIGFAGGFVRRTNLVHGEVALASYLRQKYGALLHSEIFENHHGDAAYREIRRLIAASNQLSSFAATGVPSRRLCPLGWSGGGPASVPPPRIILYGHSWGASEAVAVARHLQRDHIPVQLLIQVDGVNKPSSNPRDDSIIPANVAQAINFYQTEGLLHGRSTISAADPSATRILANIHLTYKHHPVPTGAYPWLARTFTHRHLEIENDPRVWSRVESLIAANLPNPSAPQAQ